MNAETIAAIPAAGWGFLFMLALIAGAGLFFVYQIFSKREVRFRGVEIAAHKEMQAAARENAQHEALDLISSQFSACDNLLRKLRSDMVEAGRKSLDLRDERDLIILKDIAAIVETRIAREVLLDLVRNHITGKDKEALAMYSRMKADGYWQRARTELSAFGEQLPGRDLASIMELLPIEDFRALFEGVYAAASGIAGNR